LTHGGSVGRFSRSDEFGGKLGVVGPCPALFENRDQAVQVFREERLGIQPQAWEDFRSENPIAPWLQNLESLSAADEPVDS
jgi:hypothetical protein